MTERELIFLEYSFDTNTADPVYKACQARLLEKSRQGSKPQGGKLGKGGPGAGGHEIQKDQLVHGKAGRKMQVYA
jgi:hypothetical protein